MSKTRYSVKKRNMLVCYYVLNTVTLSKPKVQSLKFVVRTKNDAVPPICPKKRSLSDVI